MALKLDPRLNLVVPIERADGSTIWTHSAPLSRQVFDAYYLLLSKAFTAIYQQGISLHAGPRVASNVLRDTIRENSKDEQAGRTLLAEIRRLTNVVMPGERGYDVLPFEDALRRELISEDDAAEAEGLITFFILNSAIHRRAILPSVLGAMCDLWGTSTTSSTVTEFAASLPTLTVAASSGGSALAPSGSSIPY